MDCIICGNWFSSVIHDGACPTCSRAIEQLRINMMPGRLQELAQAEKDGRLVVLPCKPDAIFYQWKKGDDCPSVSRFEGATISEDGEIIYPMTRWGEVFKLDDFGKTVFLTRAEAERERKEGEQDA